MIPTHIANALPAEHHTMTATVKNADIRTSIRDGLERNTNNLIGFDHLTEK